MKEDRLLETMPKKTTNLGLVYENVSHIIASQTHPSTFAKDRFEPTTLRRNYEDQQLNCLNRKYMHNCRTSCTFINNYFNIIVNMIKFNSIISVLIHNNEQEKVCFIEI